MVYTAKKVSVSGPVKDDGTIDYEVKDGEQVVLYTRIWNATTLEYEYYAVDYDGMLVRAYMSIIPSMRTEMKRTSRITTMSCRTTIPGST